MRLPRMIWRWMHAAQFPYRRNPNAPLAQLVLLLTTVGRKTGKPRVTPLQYEENDGIYYVGSARGTQADWYRNILTCPQVQVQVGPRCIPAVARPITDRARIADFLQLRLRRHPYMVGVMLWAEGVGLRPTRARLEAHAARLALIAIQPLGSTIAAAPEPGGSAGISRGRT